MAIVSFLHSALGGQPLARPRAALREALRAPLDILELVGIAAALIGGVLFARGGPATLGEPGTPQEAFTIEAIAMGLAIAAASAVFFLLRRVRRAFVAHVPSA